MKFTLADETVDVRVADLRIHEVFTQVTVQELVVIKRHTGLGLATLSKALTAMEPEAILMFAWVGLRRLGHRVDPTRLDFDLIEFCTELAVDSVPVPDSPEGAETPEDPTRPSDSSSSGRNPTPAEAVTWPPSPTT